MRHAVDHRKLRRNPAHRKSLLRNLMNALVRSERIETTVAKAKELRRLADKLITLGKRNTTHARRQVFSLLSDKANTEKLFSGLAGRFDGRPGGYTRIIRTDYRAGDGAEMAIIEYLPAEEKKAGARKTKGKKKASAPEKAVRKTAAKAKDEAGAGAKKKAPAKKPGESVKASADKESPAAKKSEKRKKAGKEPREE